MFVLYVAFFYSFVLWNCRMLRSIKYHTALEVRLYASLSCRIYLVWPSYVLMNIRLIFIICLMLSRLAD